MQRIVEAWWQMELAMLSTPQWTGVCLMVTYSGNDSGDETAPAGEDGENANKDLSCRDAERDAVRRKHPLRYFLVQVHRVVEFLGKQIRGGSAVQTPDIDGVKYEAGLAVAAEGHSVGIILLVARAVVP